MTLKLNADLSIGCVVVIGRLTAGNQLKVEARLIDLQQQLVRYRFVCVSSTLCEWRERHFREAHERTLNLLITRVN
jgi:hypothetical protein